MIIINKVKLIVMMKEKGFREKSPSVSMKPLYYFRDLAQQQIERGELDLSELGVADDGIGLVMELVEQ